MRARYIANTLHLESTTALYGPGVARTGFIEGMVFSALVSSGAMGLAGSAFAIAAITGVVSVGVSIGLSYLASSLFAPKAPKPEDVQQSVRQPTQPRVRHYGRVKASGPWVFAEAAAGDFHKVIALGQGPIDAIEEFWIDDTKVDLDGSGEATNGPWVGGSGETYARILARTGNAVETPYAELTSVFPEWTYDHRGDGVASIYALQRAVEDKYFMALFPNGINTNYRAVLRGARVKDPLTNAEAWNDNAAAVIRDYLVHRDGMRLPEGVIATPQARAGWTVAANRAAENVATKAGAEPRYRLWGSYSLEERPADVIGRMLASSDGRLVPTPDGGLTLDIGQWEEPTVTLDDTVITGFSEVGRGRDILSTANTIRAKYLDPAQDYQAADADPWADAEDVSDRGEIAKDVEFIMAPSHSQARRLMKLAAFRANPSWVGQFQCNLKALAAFGQRFVRISYPAFGINSVFEVQDFRFDIGEGGILQGVTLQLQSMPAAAYSWDPAQEEGDAPAHDESEADNTIPRPDAPVVTLLSGPVAQLSFSPAPSVLLKIEARGKPTAASEWFDIEVPDGATQVNSFNLIDDDEYEFQIRYVTEKGREGPWSDSAVVVTPP